MLVAGLFATSSAAVAAPPPRSAPALPPRTTATPQFGLAPAVRPPTEKTRTHTRKDTSAALERLVADLATRALFEMQLPDPAILESRVVEVTWYERDDTRVTGVEVFYESGNPGGPRYWEAGQRLTSREDPSWLAHFSNIPIATRFWKYRPAVVIAEPGGRSGQAQLYRFHDGVESWVAGQLSRKEATAVAASFGEANRRGVSPVLILLAGFIFIFIWPLVVAWAAVRRQRRRLEARTKREPRGPR